MTTLHYLYTPVAVYKRLDDVFHFKLDAAADPDHHLCDTYLTEEIDGLTVDWHTYGNTFINPPTIDSYPEWIKKAYHESQHGIVTVLFLLGHLNAPCIKMFCLSKGFCSPMFRARYTSGRAVTPGVFICGFGAGAEVIQKMKFYDINEI